MTSVSKMRNGVHTWWVELPSLVLVMHIIMQALHVYILSGLASNHLCWLFYLQLNVSFRVCISHFFGEIQKHVHLTILCAAEVIPQLIII